MELQKEKENKKEEEEKKQKRSKRERIEGEQDDRHDEGPEITSREKSAGNEIPRLEPMRQKRHEN